MTDKNYTHMLVITDRSGSMAGYADSMVGALNELFKGQAEVEGTCLVDYTMFDSVSEVVFTDTPVAQAEAVLAPRGMTALLDAIGDNVTRFGTKLASLPEARRPGTVMVVVITDGYENVSKRWTKERVSALIKEQSEVYKWDFTFLGANLDAVAVGADFGFAADKSLTYTQGNESIMAQSLNDYASTTRSGLASSYSDEDRAKNASNQSGGTLRV